MSRKPRLPQHGVASRRALLATAGLAAAGAGAWWAWQQRRRAEATLADPAATPSTSTADAPLVQADSLTAAFWQQHFDTPDGGSLALSALRGQALLINFWATWCPPCIKEMPELDQFARDFAPRGWQVLGLAIDGPTPVKAFLEKVRVGFAIGLAGFGGTELAQALGNTTGGLPYTVLIDAQGRIRHRKMGATTHAELAGWANDMKAT